MAINNSPETGEQNTPPVRIAEKPRSRRTVIKDSRRKLVQSQSETQLALEKGERDNLTGILNEGGFDHGFEIELQRMKRFKEKATLLYLDVNNLKIVNDKSGHPAGDALLRNVADALSETTRKIDVVGRIGGDEFAVILVGLDQSQTQTLWNNRLRQVFDKRGVSIAVGAIEIDPSDKEATKKRADSAMYEAKEISKEGLAQDEPATKSTLIFYTDKPKAA